MTKKRTPKSARSNTCRVCGMSIEQRSGRGRSRVVHAHCSKVERACSLLSSALQECEGKPFADKNERVLRADIWALANELNRVKIV